jgi:hypothetical protein
VTISSPPVYIFIHNTHTQSDLPEREKKLFLTGQRETIVAKIEREKKRKRER